MTTRIAEIDVPNYEDPELPNYRPPWWEASVKHWNEALLWTGDLKDVDFKSQYLFSPPGEGPEDYKLRIRSKTPEPYFSDAVDSTTSRFTQLVTEDNAPQVLINNANNVDGSGAALDQWSRKPLWAYFRDGACLMGVDIEDPDDSNIRRERVPYLTMIPMRNVFYPAYGFKFGRKQLIRVSIRYPYMFSTDRGKQEQGYEYLIYELTDAGCTVRSQLQNPKGKFEPSSAAQLLESASSTPSNPKPIMRIPFTDKLSTIQSVEITEDTDIFSMFRDVLNLGIEHYNAYSQYDTLTRKAATVTHYRQWPDSVPEDPSPLYSGPSKVIELGMGCTTGLVELQGNSISELRVRVENIESKIRARSSQIFYQGGNRSIAEVGTEEAKSKVRLPGIKTTIRSAFQDLFEIYEQFSNPAYSADSPVGSITIDEAAITPPVDPGLAQLLLQAATLGALNGQELRSAILRMGVLKAEDLTTQDSQLSIDQEIQ